MSEKSGKTFGERVRAIRKQLELNQTDFGRGLGISIQHLSDIELDKKKPCHDFFYNMVMTFKVNLNYLVMGMGEIFLGETGLAPTQRAKTGNPDVDVFLEYFFKSNIVKFHTLLAFSKLMDEEGDRIRKNFPQPREGGMKNRAD
jgi:transcriptional regulator with XRE-family HTH domain